MKISKKNNTLNLFRFYKFSLKVYKMKNLRIFQNSYICIKNSRKDVDFLNISEKFQFV